MATILPYRSPRLHGEMTAWIGMTIFLGSWAMMFGTLFLTYAGLRARANMWPPPGVPLLPIALPAMNTVVIAASSAALQLAVSSARGGKTSRIVPALGATFALGLVFLGLQILLWTGVHDAGLKPASGYGSVFYGLTWIHAAHVVVGLGALIYLLVQALRGRYSAARHLAIRLWAMYWHFVGAVWAVIFVSVFLI